jgi:DNA invertase Pin-like site-specific DNA recombinase
LWGDAIIAILGTVAKQERVRTVERVKAGIERARTVGTKSGRPIGAPPIVFDRARLAELRNAGQSWRAIASVLKVSVGTVRRAYSHSQAAVS